MRFSQYMKHSLLAAVTSTMVITSAFTPVEAQETQPGFIPVNTTSSTTSKTSTQSTTNSASRLTTSSRTSSSSVPKIPSVAEEPIVAYGAIPDDQQFDTLESNDGIIITGLGSVEINNGDLVIPAQIDGKQVVEIDDKAFQNKGIERIIFEDGVSLLKIGNNAFQGNKITGDLTIDVETIGDNAFAQNEIQSLRLQGIQQVGNDAFRDNKIQSIEFSPNGDTPVNLGDRSFINNRLSDEIDLSVVADIGDEAFSTNKIRTVQVGEDTVLRNKVFANNGAWVEVKTSSGADSSRGIETKSYDDKTGQVIDPVSIIVRYLDQDGKSIAPERRIGDDLENNTQAFEKGKEATFTPRKIQNYRLDTPEITFTPDSDGYVIEAKYTYVDQRPVIEINRDSIRLANGQTPTREQLMEGVKATDKDGNDITDKITIDTSSVNVDAPGVYDVIYSVVDKNGNEQVKKGQVSVDTNWAEYEFGGGWQIKDFTYEGNKVTGLSESGLRKNEAGNNALWFPPVNEQGEKVTILGSGEDGELFPRTYIESVESWGNLQKIEDEDYGEGLFQNNYSLTSIPDDWGDIEYIGENTFSGAGMLTSIPDNWGKISHIGESAFEYTKITELPNSWGKITEIDDYVFTNTRITKLPEWGEITIIGENAFSSVPIQEMPDTWGKVKTIKNGAFASSAISRIPDNWGNVETIGNGAFFRNKLSEIPDNWGDVETLGTYVFAANQLGDIPSDWGKITSIPDNAFNENQLKVISDWGNVINIGKNAFYNNDIESLPESWGNVENIGEQAFWKNNIQELPNDWGNVDTLGVRTFAENNISRLPDNWGNIKKLPERVFKDNNITEIKSWGNLEIIGKAAFEKNSISSLPKSWRNITNIEEEAFKYQIISDLPSDWGKVKNIGKEAFASNRIEEIPDEWGTVENIGQDAFRYNNISDLPEEIGGLNQIGYNAFSNNNLPSNMVFTAPSDKLDAVVISRMLLAGVPKPVTFYTHDRSTNDESETGLRGFNKDGIYVNPVKVTYNYVDEEGNTIAPSSAKIYYSDEKVEFSAPSFQHLGYVPVEKNVSFTAARKDTQTVDIVYSQVAVNQDTNTNISLDLKNNDPYLIGDDMVGNITVDRTGYNVDPIENARVVLTFNSDVYDVDSFDITSNSIGIDKNSFERNGNTFSFVIPRLNPSDSLTIPFRVKFNPYVTASNTQYPITATLIGSDDNVLRISNEESFTGYYHQPYQRITANGEKKNGLIDDYDQTVIYNENGSPISYVSDDEQGKRVRNTITYNIKNTDLNRNVGDYETRVELPRYDVHEKSSLYDADNPTRLAKFNPAQNPGWTLSEDGKYVIYKGSNNGTHNSFTNKLVLGYPGAEENQRFAVNSETTLVPQNKPNAEPVMITNDKITNHFTRLYVPQGEIIIKYPTGNHDSIYNNYFYDNTYERHGEFPWVIPFNATHTFDDAVFRDTDLDSRMYYSSVTIPEEIGYATASVIDERGATLQTVRLSPYNRTATFEKDRVIKGTELRVELDDSLQQGTQAQLEVVTRLKDPDKKIYSDNTQDTVFKNCAQLDTKQGVFGSVCTQKTIKETEQEIAAFKTQQGISSSGDFVNNVITDDSIRYTVGFTPREGMGETITNFEEIDLLPVGVDVENVTPSRDFEKLPGASWRVEENYRGTGQDAVIFTASSASPGQFTPGQRFNVGNITVRTNMKVRDGRIDNDVYVKAVNTDLANKVTNPPAGPGEWSHANVWSNYTAAAGMGTRKQIRAYDKNDQPGLWTSSVTTDPGVKLDYKLRLDNGTENARDNLVIYDIFPHVGDVGIPDERQSAFSNTYDPTRQPVIPNGYTIQYYNGDKYPSYPAGTTAQKEADRVLSRLQWDDTPTTKTKAVRIVQNEGVSINSRERVEFILPMKANAERLDKYGNPPADLIGPSAYNTFFWKDSRQVYLIEGNRVENKLQKKPISIEMRKTDDNGQPLAGAEFELRSDRDYVIATAISDDEGMVRFRNVDLQPGYTVTETSAPKGYQISSEIKEITEQLITQGYRQDPAVINLGEFENIPTPPAPKYGEVEFTKVDIDGNPLPGTKFSLVGWTDDGQYVSYMASANQDGKVIFAGVAPGNGYNLQEISSVGKWQPIKRITGISVVADQTTYAGSDTPYKGVENAIVNDTLLIPITKIGVNDTLLYNQDGTMKKFGQFQVSDGAKLDGAYFNVIDDETGEIVSSRIGVWSQSYNGGSIPNIKPNRVYRLEEITAPQGYEKIDGMNLRFKVDTKGNLLLPDGSPMKIQSSLIVPNRSKTMESVIIVDKKDQDYNPVEGAEFALQRMDNNGNWINVGESQFTDETGTVRWTINDTARYRVTEVQSPIGYFGKVTSPEYFMKRDSSKFEIFNAQNTKINPSVAKVEYLAENIATREAAAEIQNDNEGSVLEQKNGGWNVVRYLEGATFEVRENNEQGKLIETVTTGEDGKAEITAPIDENINYVLVETQTPEGYEKRVKPISFNAGTRLATDPSANKETGEFTVFVPNYKKSGRIVVSKLNASTGDPLTGASATFEAVRVNPVEGNTQDGDIEVNGSFYRPEGKTITRKTSSSAGVASFDKLEYGTYIVKEKEAPQGYLLDDTPSLFTINEDNASHTFVFDNTPVDPKVEITKYINGHDANSDLTAVWLDNDAETMDVKTVVENTGNTKLEKVTITDAIRDTDDQYINEALKTAMFTIRDADGNLIEENVANGEITLNPGDTVETTVNVASPEKGDMHRDDAHVTGYYGDIEVTDEDPAHAYRIPDVVDFILPATGAVPRFAILFLIVMTMLGVAFGIMRRKNIA